MSAGATADAAQLIGNEFVFSGGLASDTVVSDGGQFQVSSGAKAVDTTVLGGGQEIVSAGGHEFLHKANFGELGGLVDVGLITLGSGGEMDISAGGLGSGIDVHSSGALFDFDGGEDAGTRLESGGQVQVSAGGSSVAPVVRGGSEFVFSGGKVSSAVVSNGGELLLSSGGKGVDTTVLSGGTEIVSAGGHEFLDRANFGKAGGVVSVGTVILGSGGQLDISAGGVGSGIDVHSSGAEFVFSNGNGFGTRVESGGQDVVSGGGTAAGTVLQGGTEIVTAGGESVSTQVGNQSIEDVGGALASASDVTVSGGGLVLVHDFGVTDLTTVLSLGVEVLSALGTAVGTVVSAGGEQHVSSGGIASATAVGAGGTEFVFTGGEAVGMAVHNGGRAFMSSGGTLDAPSVVAGGTLTADGLVTGAAHDDGMIVVAAGILDLEGPLTGTGTFTIAAGAALSIDAATNIADLTVAGTANIGGVTVITDPVTIDAGGTIAGTGTLAGAIIDDGVITVSGGSLELTDAITGAGALTIEAGGTLRIDGAVSPGTTIAFASSGTGTLELADVSAMQGTITGKQSGDQVLNVACFAVGTRIAVPGGETPVETLRPGMRVCSAFGGSVAVIWIGRRHLRCRRHRHPLAVMPVRISAGAFATGIPARDLLLSPDHAVFVEDARRGEGGRRGKDERRGGVLIPIRDLVNGTTIVQEWVDRITYFHIELPRHDVVIAEGLKAESYLDTGNRSAFDDTAAALSQPSAQGAPLGTVRE